MIEREREREKERERERESIIHQHDLFIDMNVYTTEWLIEIYPNSLALYF